MRHPVHPALVHFPIACWSLAVAADFAFALWPERVGVTYAPLLLAVGCCMALAAMLAGLLELSRIEDGPVMKDVWMHMGLMLAAFAFFALRLFLRLDGLTPLAPNALAYEVDVVGFVTLAAGGWCGGKLVYTHGIGVAKK